MQACSWPCASAETRGRDSGTHLPRWLRLQLPRQPLAPAPARGWPLRAPARELQGRAWGWRAWRAVELRPGPWCPLAALRVLPRAARRPRLRQGSQLLGHARRGHNTLAKREQAPSAARMTLGGFRMTAPLMAHSLEMARCSDSPCSCARTQALALQLRPRAAGLTPVKLKVGRKMLLAGTWTAGAACVPAHGTVVTASGVLHNAGAARRGASTNRPAMTHAASVGHP